MIVKKKEGIRLDNEYIKVEKNIIGANIISIDSEQIQWVITPDGEYQFMDGKLVEVPPPSL